MEYKNIERSSADNRYLHRDFHKTLELGIRYVGEKYGDEAVKEYLALFTTQYYNPQIQQIRENGLSSMAKYLIDQYEKEDASDALELMLTPVKLEVRILYDPALAHMKTMGYIPSQWYRETTTTVHRVLAEQTGMIYREESYDPQTGACVCSFSLE